MPERHEIVDGVLVRKAMPVFEHAYIQLALARALAPCVATWRFGSEAEIRMGADDQVFLPDLAGWRRDRKRPEQRTRITVVPDWVCEILSDSTAHRDTGTKQATYHRAGVQHYWLLDPAKPTLVVKRWSDAGYQIDCVARGSAIVHAPPFEDVGIRLEELFDRD